MFKDPGKVFTVRVRLAKYSLLHSKKGENAAFILKYVFFNQKCLYSIDIQTLLVEKQQNVSL